MRAGTSAPAHPHAQDRSHWRDVLLIVGAGIVSAFQVGKAPTALGAVQADLALDLTTASWLLSAFAIVGALAGAVTGMAVDRLGARRLVVGGLVLQAASSALGAVAGAAPLLLATRVVEGLGFLTVTVAAPTLVVARTPARDRGRAMAFWGTFMPLGIAGMMLAGPLLGAIGWRGLWLGNAALLIVYALLLARCLPPVAQPPVAQPTVAQPAAGSRTVTADLRATALAGGPWLLGGIMTAFAAAFFAVFGFLPGILAERLAVAPETASLLAAAAVAINVVGNLACGPLLARGVRRDGILAVAFVGMALCGFVILGAGTAGLPVYAACLAFSAIGGLVPVALLDGAGRHAPRPDLVGAAVGFVMQGNNIGLVAGPALAGVIAVTSGWPAVPLLIAALAAGAIVLALVLGAAERRR